MTTSRRPGVPAWYALTALLACAPAARAGQDLAELHERARAFLLAQQAPPHDAVRIEVDELDPRLRLPDCPVPPEAFLPPGARVQGNTSVGLRCPQPPGWKLVLGATVAVAREVVVATRPLRRGEWLTAGDVRLQRSDVARLGGGFETDPRRVVGRQLLAPLAAGAVIAPLALADAAAVRRGERITVLLRTPGMEVSSIGIASADARPGERLRARNLDSGREVEGRLDAGRRLVVD